jgi:PfaB family protein
VRLAISGMAVNFSGCPNLRTFENILLGGHRLSEYQQESNCNRLSLWQVCQEALADAALPFENTAYLLPETNREEIDLPIDFAGSVEYLQAGPAWLFSVWQQAQEILSESHHDVVVAAVNNPSLDGTAAVVFQRLADAQQNQGRIYALIGDLEKTPAAGSLELGGQLQNAMAELDPSRFLKFIKLGTGNNLCALTAISETMGLHGELADLAGLIKTSLSLHRRTHFAVPQWQGPLNAETWIDTPFYVPADSRPWFQKTGENHRQAVLVCTGPSGELTGLELTDEPLLRLPCQSTFSSTGTHLMPIQADSQANLLDRLDQLSTQLALGESLPELASQYLANYDSTESHTYTLGLVSSSTDDLLREIEHAQRGIERSFETGKDWQSPVGSAFSAQPLGSQAKVAFVYPGGFNSHVGMARNLFALFPRLHDRLSNLTDNIDLSLQSRILYPRSIAPLSKEQIAELDAQLSKDPIAMITTGTAVAFLYSNILQEVFGIRPASAFGYSLGENSMMFALGVWEAADEARSNFSKSPLFHSRLAGPTMAARQHWGMPQDADLSQEVLWGNFILMAKPAQVQEALAAEERVYLTHINAPRQVVIGGEVQACKRVIASLKCMHLQAPYDYALHCEAMASEFPRLEELHSLPVESIPQTVLYNAADYLPSILDSALIAENIATALTNRLDFPRLVERVYEDGARIFIEVGAGSNCSKWIGSILKNKPHAAVWVDQAKVDEQTMLVRLLAKLVSQGVSVDLTALQESQVSSVFKQDAVLEITG